MDSIYHKTWNGDRMICPPQDVRSFDGQVTGYIE